MNSVIARGCRALDWAMEQRTEDAIANLLLLRMAKVGNKSGKCYMSVGALAEATELSPRTVQRKLRYLQLRGFIEQIEDHVRRASSCYRLCLDD